MTGGIPPALLSSRLYNRYILVSLRIAAPTFLQEVIDIKQVRGREVHTKALCSDAVNGRSKHWPIMALYGKRETLSRRQTARTDGSCFSPRNRKQHLPDIMKYDLLTLTVLEYPSDGNL